MSAERDHGAALARRQRRRMRLIAFLVGVLAAVAFVPACRAQTARAVKGPDRISYAELSSYAGVTICWKDRAYSYLAANLTALEFAETTAHEAKHREQMARFATCDLFNGWYQTPKGKMESEAEAYGAGWCVAVSMGADGESRRQVNRLEITQAVVKYEVCP